MKRSMIIHPEELSRKWIDRLADAGVETIGIHPVGGSRAAESLTELLCRIETKEYRDLIDYAHNRGLTVEYELHAAGYLMPRNLFREHPEYFRMDENGERTADYNFCLGSEEGMDLVAQRAAELALSLYGTSHRFYFWMDDGHRLHCHCPRCRDLSASDQQLLVLKRMLREIRKHIPDATMAYLAYMDTVVPPEKAVVDDGIFLEYAPFEKYTASTECAAELIAREYAMIAPLMAAFGGEVRKVLEYWYDNSLYSKWTKPPRPFTLNAEAMRSDIARYRRDGFNYISTFACYLGEDYEALYGEVDVEHFTKM